MRQQIYPCMGCKERHVGCHSGCKLYLEAKAKYDEMKAMEDEARHNDIASVEAALRVKEATIRGRHW